MSTTTDRLLHFRWKRGGDEVIVTFGKPAAKVIASMLVVVLVALLWATGAIESGAVIRLVEGLASRWR